MRLKRLFAFIMISVLVLGTQTLSSNAMELERFKENDGYIVLNDSVILPIGQNYDNPMTGEYFHWEYTLDSQGPVLKTFSFKIQHSITSTSFTSLTSRVTINTSAHIEDYWGTVSTEDNTGHRYTVDLINKNTCKSIQYAIGRCSTGIITGLNAGTQYKVRITNNDSVADLNYLTGHGSIMAN